MSSESPRSRAERWLQAGLAAVEGGVAVGRGLRRNEAGQLEIAGLCVPPRTGVWVVAIGKAASAMACAAAGTLADQLRGGLVVTKDGHGRPMSRLAVREAGHPVPDQRGAAAAREILDLVAGMPPTDRLLVLLSGGASALATCPPPAIPLRDVALANEAMLAGGVDIGAINSVRKHLSLFSGGRLAGAARTRAIDVLAISDVRGDALDVIGSGPCAADPTTFADAVEVVTRPLVRARVPATVRAYLEQGASGAIAESPKPGDPALERVRTSIVASNVDARRAVIAAASGDGVRGIDLGEGLQGEARFAGRRLAALASSVAPRTPLLLVVGGETTVTVRGEGRGGRSQELALASALAWPSGASGLLAVGTDGTDGPTDAAGAWVDAGTLGRDRARERAAVAALADNDAYAFFDDEGGLLRTGPTGTNVMDLVLLTVG